MAQVALAWVLRHPVVDAPIVGPTKPHHLPDAVAALDVHLTDDEVRLLEEPYGPHQPTGSDPHRCQAPHEPQEARYGDHPIRGER